MKSDETLQYTAHGTNNGPRVRVCFPYVGDSLGGSHVSSLLLVRQLYRTEFEPLIVLHNDGPLAGYLRDNGLPYILIPAPNLISNEKVSFVKGMLFELPRITLYMRSQRIRIIHTNDARTHRIWTVIARLIRAKHVWHQRSFPPRSGPSVHFIRFAHAVVTISSTVTRTLPAFVPDAKVAQIDNPVEFEQPQESRSSVRTPIYRELGLSPKSPLILCVGNLYSGKRPLFLVEVSNLLTKRLSEPPVCLLAGADRDGNGSKLQDLIDKHNLSHNVRWLGFRHDIRLLLKEVDVLVAPAVHEAFGRTLIEAMRVGTPVVAADYGGHQEIVNDGQTGLLFKPDDPSDCADKISLLLESPHIAVEIYNNAYAWAYCRFSPVAHATELTSLYRRLVCEPVAERAVADVSAWRHVGLSALPSRLRAAFLRIKIILER